MQNMNPIALLSQIDNFKKNINGDPEQIVRQMVQSGQISQVQLNEAQKQASQIMQMIQK